MEEDAKICFLFKQVKHSVLQKPIEELKYHMATNPSGTVSYTEPANNLRKMFLSFQNTYPGTGV